MPLVLKHNAGKATLLVWSIAESEDELRLRVTAADRASAERFNSSVRRMEHLAWRAALRTMIPEGEVSYGETCSPRVEGAGYHIGVAHSGACAVVIISDQPCAVDIERTARDFTTARARFISAKESLLGDSPRPDFAAAMWCAKETMYKYSGRRELDFLKDLEVTASDLAHGKMIGRLCAAALIPLHVIRSGEYLIVYIAGQAEQ